MARIQPVDLGVDPTDLDRAMRVQLGVGGIIAHRPEIAAGLGAVSDAERLPAISSGKLLS